MVWLLQIFRLAGTAAIGYFANDAATAIGKVLPDSAKSAVTDKKTGGVAWWFIAIVMMLLAGVFILVFKMFQGRSKKAKIFSWLAFLGLCAYQYFFPDTSGYVTATFLVTLATGAAVVTSANLQFLPERIEYIAATQLTGVKITVQGDGVVYDSDTNGLTHTGVNRVIGQVTNSYILTLASNLFKGKNCLFEFTNSAAQTPAIYYDSDSTPQPGEQNLFLQMMKIPLLVGGNDFENFATLSLPSLSATDSVTLLYRDGTVQANMNRQDLQYKMGYKQSVVNTPIYMIDNLDRQIKAVSVVCGVAQVGYMQRWTPSLSGGMVRGQD